MPKLIPLTKGLFVIVDDEDFDKMNEFKWHTCTKDRRPYALRTERFGKRKDNKKHHIYMHRILIDAPIGKSVDHINGDSLDNRKENLRLCTTQQNSANSAGRPNKRKSKYKGVKKNANCSTWSARITVNRKEIYLGCFKTEEHAAYAYNKAAMLYFQEFARLN